MADSASRMVGAVETSGALRPAEIAAHRGVWRGLRFYRLDGGLALPQIVQQTAPAADDPDAPPPTLDDLDDVTPDLTPSYLRPRDFYSAPSFYQDLSSDKLKSGDWVVLHRVRVSEWLPLWPGLIHNIGNQAAAAFDANLPDQESVSTGDTRMVMSGVGTVRLLPTPADRPRFAWSGATFDGAAHTGIPLRVDAWRHADIFNSLRKNPVANWDIIGKLYVEPSKRPGIVPKLYIDALQLVARDDAPDVPLRATLSVIAAAESDVTAATWLFGYVSFCPETTDPRDAARWLREHFKLAERPALYDCDAHLQHFPHVLHSLHDLVAPPPVRQKGVSGSRKSLAELSLFLRARLSPDDITDTMRDLGGHSALGEPEAAALVVGRPVINQIETMVEAAARGERLAQLCHLLMLRRPDLAESLLAWRFRNRKVRPAPTEAPAALPAGWQQLRLDALGRKKAG